MHKGLLPRHIAQKSARAANGPSKGDETAAAVRPEMSAPLANYVDLVRHGAVRLAIADAPKIALRLMLAHVIGGGRWWKVEPEPRRPATTAIGDAIDKLPSRAAFAERQSLIASLLAMDETETLIVRHDHDGERTATVFARLLDMADKDVMRVLAVVMAETLAAGTQLIDTLGTALNVDVGKHWQPDETFFALVKDREAVSG
ncbi:MAG: chromosome partitioning protein ParB, partial [Pseudomonadota bacterium]